MLAEKGHKDVSAIALKNRGGLMYDVPGDQHAAEHGSALPVAWNVQDPCLRRPSAVQTPLAP